MRYCGVCLVARVTRGTAEAMNHARRRYRRRRSTGQVVVMGPCPCKECGTAVVYLGPLPLGRWVDPATGERHWCGGLGYYRAAA